MSEPLVIRDWVTPATAYPEITVGSFRIKRRNYSKGWYAMSGLDDAAMFEVKRGGIPITNLQELRGKRWHTWMVDDPPHWRAMQFYASKAHGKVVTAGLGLGLIHHALAENPNVESVDIVERSQDVIQLMGKNIPDYKIHMSDWYEWEADFVPDVAIVDLWVASNAKEKQVAYDEALLEYIRLQERWPGVLLFFHGFGSLCDELWPISEGTLEVLKLLAEGF